MAHYKKGANAERELIHRLYGLGMAVVRVAGSGKTSLPAPDLVALSRKKKLAFECKAWKGNYLNIPMSQVLELKEWGFRSGAELYIAWKVPRQDWFFIPLDSLSKAEKSYTINLKNAKKKAIDLGIIIGKQAQINL